MSGGLIGVRKARNVCLRKELAATYSGALLRWLVWAAVVVHCLLRSSQAQMEIMCYCP